MKNRTITALLLTAACPVVNTALQAEDWKDSAISPVANPLFFESPLIQSEARPIFMYHNIDDDFIGGFVRVYAAQLRWAVNERLAIIATKDGFIQTRSDALSSQDGWADIGAGLKYALIDKPEDQFILTPGMKFEFASGNTDVFQGNGDGEFDFFVSSMKGWDKFHVTGSLGARVPIDMDEETSSLHYSLQLDYQTCKYFTPFVVANGFTTLSEGDGPAFGGIEGVDLINFGASDNGGRTQITVGVGFRSQVWKHLDLGFAYESGLTSPKGLFDDRFTFDCRIPF